EALESKYQVHKEKTGELSIDTMEKEIKKAYDTGAERLVIVTLKRFEYDEQNIPEEDIFRKELDISSIKSNKAIPDYRLCMECDIIILTEDLPRLLVLNVCSDMIYQTYAKKFIKMEHYFAHMRRQIIVFFNLLSTSRSSETTSNVIETDDMKTDNDKIITNNFKT
ncbi:15721_t:CDS:2, partial [Funneliformis mosseae]